MTVADETLDIPIDIRPPVGAADEFVTLGSDECNFEARGCILFYLW